MATETTTTERFCTACQQVVRPVWVRYCGSYCPHCAMSQFTDVPAVAAAPERTVYGTRIGRHWAFVVSSASDLHRFTGETTTAEYPCEACGCDRMRLERLAASWRWAGWHLTCDACGVRYEVSEMPARQCNGQGE